MLTASEAPPEVETEYATAQLCRVCRRSIIVKPGADPDCGTHPPTSRYRRCGGCGRAGSCAALWPQQKKCCPDCTCSPLEVPR